MHNVETAKMRVSFRSDIFLDGMNLIQAFAGGKEVTKEQCITLVFKSKRI